MKRLREDFYFESMKITSEVMVSFCKHKNVSSTNIFQTWNSLQKRGFHQWKYVTVDGKKNRPKLFCPHFMSFYLTDFIFIGWTGDKSGAEAPGPSGFPISFKKCTNVFISKFIKGFRIFVFRNSWVTKEWKGFVSKRIETAGL